MTGVSADSGRGEVDDLDATGGQRVGTLVQDRHAGPSPAGLRVCAELGPQRRRPGSPHRLPEWLRCAALAGASPEGDAVAELQHKILLDESEMPTQWYNIVPDLPSPPPPPLHPGTLQPVGPDDLAPLFPMDLILQEVSSERYIDIPGEVLDVYRLWRPSPLFRAHRLEQALGTPARIYYKYEGVSPAGSHKPNTAVPQAYYNATGGRAAKLTTETGAGQWGTALAFACALFGLECEVWQVGASYDQKPYRRIDDRDLRRARCTGRRRSSPRPAGPSAAEDAAPPRLARHRDLRGGRGRRAGPGGPLRARQRAQPRAAAPDDHRRGGAAAVRQGRRDAGPHRRLHRRRLELRRPVVPVPAREAGRQDGAGHPRGRAGVLPVADPRAPTPTTSATPPG